MKNLNFIGLILIIVAFNVNCNSKKRYNKTISSEHTVKELRKDIDFTFREIEKLHPKLYWYITKENLDFKIDSVKKSITQPMTSKEFYFVLFPLVSEIRQAHNHIEFPRNALSKKDRLKYTYSNSCFDSLQLETINNKVFVTNSVLKDSTILHSQVLQIGEFSTDELIKKHNAIYNSDGYNTTFINRRSGMYFKKYYGYENQLLDTVAITLKKNDSVFIQTYYRNFEKIPSRKERKKIVKTKKKESKNTAHSEFINLKVLKSDTTISYLKILSFSTKNYEKIYKNVFKKIDAAKSQTLIIDLRNNLGGTAAEAQELLKHLYSSEISANTFMESKLRFPLTNLIIRSGGNISPKSLTLPFYLIYEIITSKKSNNVTKSRKFLNNLSTDSYNSYSGKLFLLVNGTTFSASCDIAASLHGSKRATIVGEETGGAYNGTVAGDFKKLQLPNSKLIVSFGLLFTRTQYLQTPDGYGVIPDVQIEPTIADRKNGIDTELNYIIEKVKADRLEKALQEVEKEEKENEVEKELEESPDEKK